MTPEMNCSAQDPTLRPGSLGRNRTRLIHPFTEFRKDEIEQSIPDRFERKVKEYRGKVAVKSRNHEWSYEELNRTANRVAHSVLGLRGGGGQRIALLFEHDAPMIAGLLGVLKTGKTYVPLDPSYPRDRLAYMLEDSQSGKDFSHINKIT